MFNASVFVYSYTLEERLSCMIKWYWQGGRTDRRMFLAAGDYNSPIEACAPYTACVRRSRFAGPIESSACVLPIIFTLLYTRIFFIWQNTGDVAVCNCTDGFYTFSILNYISAAFSAVSYGLLRWLFDRSIVDDAANLVCPRKS